MTIIEEECDYVKKKIFMTGASGGMGQQSLSQMIQYLDLYDLTLLSFDSEVDRKILAPYEEYPEITIIYGDLLDYELVEKCLIDADLVLHIAAFVSPAADYYPKKAMEVNYGSIRNILQAISALKQNNKTKLVNIGTVAQTGDRMPPIHWGRVGDPIKTSIYDYYAVSKVAAERLVIESDLANWVSLRQTGIMGLAMSKVEDAIMFHNCLDNAMEYVSDRDSGRLMANLCHYECAGKLPNKFWNHIYNIGGGESCRVNTYEMYKVLYGQLGFSNLDYVIDPKWYATRNFHGQYYLDSDKLENYLHFRHDGMEYFYQCYLENLGTKRLLAKMVCQLPRGQKMMGRIMKKSFLKEAKTEHGTVHFIEEKLEDQINAYWGSKRSWDKIPNKLSEFQHFKGWEKQVILDHGYDEEKDPNLLTLSDVQQAAKFRGGECLSIAMEKGNWHQKILFKCAFGHTFHASCRLVLEGGHWCSVCERENWNYSERAKKDMFFAQVWDPLHGKDETTIYPKIISELDV